MILYKVKKKGLFAIHSGKWDKTKGSWEDLPKELEIIGETFDAYITEIVESSTPYWDEMGRYEAFYSLPLGVHKSRLIKWIYTQLSLFN